MMYSVNALDHSYEPALALRTMLAVAKPCAWVVFELWENEAVLEKGSGMHKWNVAVTHRGQNRAIMTLTKFGGLDQTDLRAMLLSRQQNEHGPASYVRVEAFHGCYLNGDCNRAQDRRVRLSARKQGEHCPRQPPIPRAS